jgi:8-oxo-dGTP pyrophosphatase MutT (NUDIX family)
MGEAGFGQRIGRLVDDYLGATAGRLEYLALLRWQIAEGHALDSRETYPGHVTTSALILSPDGRQTLLVDHKIMKRWLQPGGHYEPAAFLWQSARREALEETGLDGLVLHAWHRGEDRPFVIDSHDVPGKASRGEVPHVHHDFQYLFVAEPGARLEAELDEVSGVRWFPVEALAGIAPRALERLAAGA